MKTKHTILLILGALACIAVLRDLHPFFIPEALRQQAIPSQQQALYDIVSPSPRTGVEQGAPPMAVNIPEGAGHIVGCYTAPAEKARIIIHIQDIHTNYEAQKNLSRILETLVRDNQLKLIMVEGGWGDVSLSYLRAYASHSRREEVAEEYLREGKISGEEYLDIISDYNIQLEGIEDESLYQANLETFFAIEEFRRQAAGELANIIDVLETLQNKIYHPQLLELQKAKQAYDNEHITLAAYYQFLYGSAVKTGQSLAQYQNLVRFIAVVESEQAIKFPAVERERSALIEKLSQSLSKTDLTTLVTQSLEFRLNKLTPLQYHEYLLATARNAGEPINRYANLNKYVAYIRSHEDIETAVMFEEADALLRAVEETYIKDERQRKLYIISRSAQVLDNFLHLKLVPNDFEYYKNNRNSFLTAGWEGFLEEQAQRYKIRTTAMRAAVTLDNNLSTLVQFYDLANERDKAFVANATRLMDREKASAAVLIAGGFHTPNLRHKFKESGFSYIIIAPHTTQPTDHDLYRRILKYKAGKE
jgi:hypothetical protein